ncbi:hypothetical protein AC579_10511 [Pseudocercospora musae]|uniref:C2H2-type domain-containing protein n=1 Tax=Pseudocercospora musae TaxID=113226 RepID=A0A139I5L0_9PEZI|nr:hypothetical protein AC579_10511 [Pseudocercospora musae]
MPGAVRTMGAAKTEKAGPAPLGRRAANSSSSGSKNDDVVAMEDAEHEVDDLTETKPKKKRRVIKTADKKYECPQPDCGKSYSRAEHLYRHQLNHTPKQIYHCDFPGCDRHFVRADLCARHKERHTAKGSHLQRKDAFLQSQRQQAGQNANAHGESATSGATTNISSSPNDSSHVSQTAQPDSYMPPQGHAVQPYATARDQQYPNHTRQQNQHVSEPPSLQPNDASVNPSLSLGNAYNAYQNSYGTAHGSMAPPTPTPIAHRRYSIEGQLNRPTSMGSSYGQQTMTQIAMHPPPLPQSSQQQANMYNQQTYPPPGQDYRQQNQNNYGSLPALPPFGMPPAYTNRSSAMSPPSLNSQDHFAMSNSRAGSVLGEFNILDQYAAGYAMPVFGNEGFNRSPQTVLALDDALFNQLLESNGMVLDVPSPPPETTFGVQMPNIPPAQLEAEGKPEEPQADTPQAWDTHSPPAAPGMDLSLRESIITEHKQNRIINVVRSFEDIEKMPGRKVKEDIMSGDTNEPNHPLSVNMLRTYITSYWIHIHQQMPILHRPTFNPETCPDALLLSMMCLGACCLERTHSPDHIKNCAELAFFAAYHIRWEVFRDPEFRPTAKLWTFQTMLLLELFEKMYSTRALHERAHIHHATTLTVMRRGSSLIGRSANDTPAGTSDPTRTPPGPEGSINTSGQNTPDAFWNRWITAEATRRVAFAAFIIDSTHATLFGHSAVMSPHDLRLPLPCDEALWAATSSAEVQRVEASLAANGFKPTSFLEGLKKTLNGQKVRTNVFGRVILMAGLLNVSWHMNQRDLQVSSLGASSTLGSATRWRSPLTRAFDFWRRDFDDSLSKNDVWLQVCNAQTNKSTCHADHRDNVFESRSCLHSLAHMAMHVDIVDCEVFAGSDRALGRVVTESDRAAVQRRMREQWAPSARARDATFYALRFLCEVLVPAEALEKNDNAQSSPPPTFRYSARDDYLLNRPYILYFACMIVWSYGYALDGPLGAFDCTLATRDQQIRDLQRYLIRVGGIASPDDLEGLKDRNSCVGLLILMRECFRQPRWELLHEASDMMDHCVKLLLPGETPKMAPRAAA